MRAIALRVMIVVGPLALGGAPFAADPAAAQALAPVALEVPGPLRPITAVPPMPIEAPRDRLRPNVGATRPAQVAPSPEASVMEGVFRPGAPGEKAGGRAVARPAKKELRLEKLVVTPGRDLELWLVAVDRIGNGEDLSDTKRVSLGRLKKAEGDQSYRLPPEIDLRVYRQVVVWSRRERSARAGALLGPQAAVRQTAKKPRRKR